MVPLALLGPSALLDLKVPPAHKDQKVTPVPLVLLELQAPLVLLVLLAQLDLRVPPVPKDLRATPVQPAQLARLGRKGLRDLLDRPEVLAADRNFKVAALSWSRLESAA